MYKKYYYLAVVLILLIASVFLARKLKKNYVPQIDLSAIPLKDLDGNTVKLSNFSGKPLVVNFWGSWCGPCRKEFPGFEKVKEKFGSQVNFVMVSDEPIDKIKKFKTENNYTFFYAQSQKKFHELGITSVPVTSFYDSRGELVAKKKDPLNEDELNGFIDQIIK